MTGSVWVFWLGKTAKGDDHLIFDGDDVRKCRTVKRRPECLRWDRQRVDAVECSSSANETSTTTSSS